MGCMSIWLRVLGCRHPVSLYRAVSCSQLAHSTTVCQQLGGLDHGSLRSWALSRWDGPERGSRHTTMDHGNARQGCGRCGVGVARSTVINGSE